MTVAALTTRDEAIYWSTHLHSTPPLGGSRRNIAIRFSAEKLEWCDYWLPDGEKRLKTWLLVLTKYTKVTVKQTDGQPPHDAAKTVERTIRSRWLNCIVRLQFVHEPSRKFFKLALTRTPDPIRPTRRCPPPVFTRRSTMHFGLSMGRCAGSDICWPVRGWPLHGPTDRTFGCCWPAAASGANSNSCVSCSNRYRACLQRSLQIQRRRHWQQIRVYVRVTQPDVPFRGPSLLSFTKASFLRVCSLCRGP